MNSTPPQTKGHIAAIEAGGTKFVCATAKDSHQLLDRVRIPTSFPAETFPQVVDFLKSQEAQYGALAGIGIATFGSLDVDPLSPSYGIMGNTPKMGWSGVDVLEAYRAEFDVPIAIDTDVNCAALGEGLWGAARGKSSYLYVTIGTGIGGGAISGGRLVRGISHPEMGHIVIPHDKAEDPFPGICPYHGDCFEGLASGPAIEARWGASSRELPPNHPAWSLEATYIASALVSYAMILSPQRIILGGGVMHQTHLWPLIRAKVATYMQDYLPFPEMGADIEQWICAPEYEGDSALLGALALVAQSIPNNKI